MMSAPFTIVFSTVFWRSSWKYRTRGYRYCFWDNGTVAANLLAGAAASGLPARVVNAFVDEQVDELLGIDGVGEATTCLVSLGSGSNLDARADATGSLGPVGGSSVVSAPGEIDYPDIRETHAATLLADPAAVSASQGELALPLRRTDATFFAFP